MNLVKRVVTGFTETPLRRNYLAVLNRAVAYKSAISLENLYPNSSFRITTPSKPESSMSPKFSGYIPVEELDITYSRSSGPGGQNVNKVNTKVDLRFHLESAKWLQDDIKVKLAEKLKSKLSKEGYLIIKSDLTRSQQLNVADCLEKLRSSILGATYEAPPTTPETLERIRRRQEKSTRERLIQKRMHSQTKADRQPPSIRNM